MILLLITALPAIILLMMAFFKFSPKGNTVRIYNWSAVVLLSVVCMIYSRRVKSLMVDTVDSAWWPVIAFIYSTLILVGGIIGAGVIRNFFLFKNED